MGSEVDWETYGVEKSDGPGSNMSMHLQMGDSVRCSGLKPVINFCREGRSVEGKRGRGRGSQIGEALHNS